MRLALVIHYAIQPHHSAGFCLSGSLKGAGQRPLDWFCVNDLLMGRLPTLKRRPDVVELFNFQKIVLNCRLNACVAAIGPGCVKSRKNLGRW